METLIVDKDGQWLTNPNAYPFPDPESGTLFAPGGLAVKIKVPKTGWIATQLAAGVLVKTDDPTTAPQEAPKA